MVQHDVANLRFVWSDGVHEAILSYHYPEEGVIVFNHTYVPRELEGQGVGSALVNKGFEFAEGKGLKIESTCSFVSAKLARRKG